MPGHQMNWVCEAARAWTPSGMRQRRTAARVEGPKAQGRGAGWRGAEAEGKLPAQRLWCLRGWLQRAPPRCQPGDHLPCRGGGHRLGRPESLPGPCCRPHRASECGEPPHPASLSASPLSH